MADRISWFRIQVDTPGSEIRETGADQYQGYRLPRTK